MSRLSYWYQAAVSLLNADRDEDEALYKQAVADLRDLVERPLQPGVSTQDVLHGLQVIERHISHPSTLALAADIGKLCLASFKKGELVWKEAAHRKMEEMRGVMQMEIAVEKAELVERLRKQDLTMDGIPTRDQLVEMFNQPATKEHPIVHSLYAGRTLCPMTFVFHVPGQFPEHHKWASDMEAKDLVTCVVCKKALP